MIQLQKELLVEEEVVIDVEELDVLNQIVHHHLQEEEDHNKIFRKGII